MRLKIRGLLFPGEVTLFQGSFAHDNLTTNLSFSWCLVYLGKDSDFPSVI